jgi:hypothetical protein
MKFASLRKSVFNRLEGFVVKSLCSSQQTPRWILSRIIFSLDRLGKSLGWILPITVCSFPFLLSCSSPLLAGKCGLLILGQIVKGVALSAIPLELELEKNENLNRLLSSVSAVLAEPSLSVLLCPLHLYL